MPRLIPIAALALIIAPVVGCSDDEDESAACGAVDELRASAGVLYGQDIAADGLAAIDAQIDVVRADLDTARQEVSTELADEIAAVEVAIAGLRSSIDAAPDAAAKLQAASTGAPAVRTALEALETAATETCD